MKIVFFGTSAFGLPALEALLKSRHTLQAVVATPDKPAGRNRKPQAVPVKRFSLEKNLALFEMRPGGSAELIQKLRPLKPDAFLVISFGRLLNADLLKIPSIAPVNIHASLLPMHRGASPMAAAILDGDKKTGVTVMRMTEKLDAGDIGFQMSVPVSPQEDALTLEDKLSRLAAEASVRAMDELEAGKISWTAQNEADASYAPKIRKQDGRIQWQLAAEDIGRRLRAYAGWPGSYCFLRGKRLIVWKARVLFESAETPGRILSTGNGGGIVVAAGRQSLALLELQQEGRKRLPAADFIKGFPLKPGDVLE